MCCMERALAACVEYDADVLYGARSRGVQVRT
jgi:hypothetical protein